MKFPKSLRHLLPGKRRKKRRSRPASADSKNTKNGKGGQRKYSGDMPNYPRNKSAFKRKSYSPFRQFIIRASLIGGVLFVVIFIGFYATLPDIDDLNKFTKAPSILIKSEDGQIIGSFGDIYGEYVPFNALPSSLVDAVVATEDRNFYHHFGIDPYGLLRAAFANIRAHHVVQGGSTITQQVAKNVFLTPERSFARKIKEMMLAIKLERRFSKQDIMSIYLNRVYLGAGNYGVDAAAHRYFEKSARDLTLSESAIIAGLLKAPSRFAPTSNPVLSRQRADQVLVNMAEAGYLTEKQTVRARDELSKSMGARKHTSQSTLYFADWIMDQLPEYIGNVQEDIVVISTLKPEWQALAEKAVTEVMDKEGAPHEAKQAALLAMTPDGAIRAMIGGRSYAESQYNRATQSLRQPGSSFKLFVYLAGLEDGMTPETMMDDQPISVKIAGGYWQPKNYTNKYLGNITLKEAVTESVNTIAVQVAQRVGLEHVINVARRLGISTEIEAVPSIALGATEVSLLELTTAYSHLAANGAIVYPYGILEIDNRQGQPIYQRQMPGGGVVLRSDVVGHMNEMLLNVVESGTGKSAKIGRPAAGKTGTTSDYRDAWFMGYTPDLVAGVWVGNDDNSTMKKVTGGMLPAQIWREFMTAALAGTPVRNIPTEARFAPSLPWQGQAPSFPQQPGAQERMQRQPQSEEDIRLGPAFWDKLLNNR